MALAHQSIATINSPQFINLQPLDINPLMSACEIKVLYIGENRNRSFISKQVATEMAKTLRGAPIVGYYKKDKQDFADHGEQMIWDDEGIHFNCLTKPYGFVAPDAKVWFQDFEDKDDFGNSITRTYLMTTGYLWTGQFEEVNQVLSEGRPQSMELDEKSLQGKWSTNIKQDIEFFIINDAIFSKLCILGDDVEPCFEGSAVTAPQVSTSFTLDGDFKQTLFKMMQELTDALKGGNTVQKKDNQMFEQQEQETTDSSLENKDKNEQFELDENQVTTENQIASNENVTTDFEQKDKEAKEEEKEEQDKGEEKSQEDEDKEDKYSLLEEKYNALQTSFAALEQEVINLREFKKNIDNQQKDELIKEFSMLSDEDKADVLTNKEKYTLDEIKSKLAVICFEKKVNFNSDTFDKNKEQVTEKKPTIVFNVEDREDSTPDWVKEVESTMKNVI